ncbi:MAG: DinB family protein, partial [Ignavibacteriaceae bacterium]|nr:DinB family protein [Ignavibacteriaceae bacterium]
MKKKYRKGAIGALMDEYERAAKELKNLVGNISESD